MTQGLCQTCKYKTGGQMSLCAHPVILEVQSEVEDRNYSDRDFAEATTRAGVRKRLELKFLPGSWAVTECAGFQFSASQE